MTNLNETIGLSDEKDSILPTLPCSGEGTNTFIRTTKYCRGCKETLCVKTCFYISRVNSYQALCKVCHNKVRNEHARNTQIKKPTGFQKLSIETQESIIKDMFYYNKFKEEQGWDYNISKIIRKYNDIKYHNFMNWIKKGKIPTYTQPTIL